MLGNVKPIAILSLAWGCGFLIIVILMLIGAWRLRRRHPLPLELKAASYRDKRKLAKWFRGGNIDVDPNLTQIYLRYMTSSTPLYKRGYHLNGFWGVFTALGLLFLNPIEHPEILLLIVIVLILSVVNYRRGSRLERFVSHANEASRGGSSEH
jgi:amino acid transporter